MANANTEVSLEALHQAIAADITAAFPQLVTVEFYREELDRTLPPMPACLLQLTEFEAAPDLDPGTEQLAVVARFEARVLIGFRTTGAKVAIRSLAAGLSAWLRKRRWVDPENGAKKLPTGPCEVIGAFPDDFTPELDQCEVWRVEWTQVVHLGAGVAWDEGEVPQRVFFSWDPDIGIPHEADYVEMDVDPAP